MDFLGEKEIQTSLYKIVYLFIYIQPIKTI